MSSSLKQRINEEGVNDTSSFDEDPGQRPFAFEALERSLGTRSGISSRVLGGMPDDRRFGNPIPNDSLVQLSR